MSWRNAKLGDLGQVVTGKTPSRARPDYFGIDHPFVTPSDFGFMNYYCRDVAEGVSESGFEKHKNQTVPLDATLCVCIGNTIGKCAIAPEPCLTNQQINSVIAGQNSNPKFIYYLLCNMREQIRMVGLGGGAAQPIINKSKFSALEVRVPDLRTQQAIAEALSAYDDLIDNNRRRILLLEEAARLLYRKWFVHFRFPGHEFCKIIDGIPEEWKRRTIGNVAKTNRDSYRAKQLPEELNYIDISSVARGRILSKKLLASTEAPGRARRKAEDGDVIWSNVRPNLRAYALTHLYHALNKHSYFQWVTTFERCVWHYRRLLGDYTMVFWMPPGSGSTLKAS